MLRELELRLDVFVDEVFLFLALGGRFVKDGLGAGEGVLGLLQPGAC